jgi:hypothetical protein
MKIGHTLAVTAALGILAGCGGETPAAQTPSTETTTSAGAKASCGGADHTDKNHCSGATGATPAAASSSAAPATAPPPAK